MLGMWLPLQYLYIGYIIDPETVLNLRGKEILFLNIY